MIAAGIVLVGDEVHDGQCQHRDRAVEVEVAADHRVREQFPGQADVRLHHDALIRGGEQGIAVRHHHRVVVDVGDVRPRVDLVRHLVDGALGGQAHPDVKELVDPGLAGQEPDRPAKEPAVLKRGPPLAGHLGEYLLAATRSASKLSLPPSQ